MVRWNKNNTMSYDKLSAPVMFCRMCGNKMAVNEKFCPKCGTASVNEQNNSQPVRKVQQVQPTQPVYYAQPVNSFGRDIGSMIIVLIMCFAVAISPFIKMYSVDIHEKLNFSVYGLLDKTSDVYDELDSIGIDFDFDSSRSNRRSSGNSSSSDAEGIILVIVVLVIFALIMYVVAIIEAIVGLIYAVSNSPLSYGKFWRATVSASIAVWVSNLIIWGVFMLINLCFKEIAEHYGVRVRNIIDIVPIHYIIQTIALVVYVMSHGKYREYKKAVKAARMR